MSENLMNLQSAVAHALGGLILNSSIEFGELTVVVKAADYFPTCLKLRDDLSLKFDQLIDLCGVDYSQYGNEVRESDFFWVVVHLLSVEKNQRIRIKTACVDDDLPSVASLVSVWSSAGWYEREAFDLYGIVFDGHPDLRRILTDYGFVGHPFRKDFPLSGHVEMRYDPELGRVVYQPVTIEPREVTPRIIREPQYGGVK